MEITLCRIRITGYTILPFQADGLTAALEQLQGGAMVDNHGFTLATDKTSTASCTVTVPRSVWSMLGGQRGSLLDVYGGEWDFDRRTATLRASLGQALNVVVRYGKNLQTLEQDENISNCWTAVLPYWLSSDETALVTLPEITVSTGEFDYVRTLVLDLSAEWEEAPTEEQLRSRTETYIRDNDVGVPDVGLDVSFVSLAQTEEYGDRAFIQDVHKGDLVEVEFPTAWDRSTGAPKTFVRAKARAVEYVWLPMEDKYESVRLGKPRANFVSVLAQVEKNVEWVMTKVR